MQRGLHVSVKAIAFAAFLMIGAGVLTGLLPVTWGGSACGSAFVEVAGSASLPGVDEGAEVDVPVGCDDVRNLVRIPAIVLIAAGAATLVAAGAARWRVTMVRD
ncbi:hypothetical protein ACQP25_36015 [Microtetraspora malaysiensis]|uniref:hypothetical protein n=1 Tax=Microtetraspora malaysiensis TaxID=161358 RepID=UPI003D91531F